MFISPKEPTEWQKTVLPKEQSFIVSESANFNGACFKIKALQAFGVNATLKQAKDDGQYLIYIKGKNFELAADRLNAYFEDIH